MTCEGKFSDDVDDNAIAIMRPNVNGSIPLNVSTNKHVTVN